MPANVTQAGRGGAHAAREQAPMQFAATSGKCDFVKDVALHYPLRVVMNILGVPPEDLPRMLRLTQELFGASDPDTERFKEAMSDEQFANC
jgi:cytochrome P450